MSKKSIISEYLASIGARGGKASGKSKARSSEQARAAVTARWAKRRERLSALALRLNSQQSERVYFVSGMMKNAERDTKHKLWYTLKR